MSLLAILGEYAHHCIPSLEDALEEPRERAPFALTLVGHTIKKERVLSQKWRLKALQQNETQKPTLSPHLQRRLYIRCRVFRSTCSLGWDGRGERRGRSLFVAKVQAPDFLPLGHRSVEYAHRSRGVGCLPATLHLCSFRDASLPSPALPYFFQPALSTPEGHRPGAMGTLQKT